MKLLSRNHDGCTFLLGKKERRILLELLQRFPVLNGNYQDQRSKKLKIKPAGDRHLLVETLEEFRKQTRRDLEEILNDEHRWVADSRGMRLLLTPDQLKILLQVLNDVKVGSWVRLGCPSDLESVPVPALNKEIIELTWAVNTVTVFQMVFLQALDND